VLPVVVPVTTVATMSAVAPVIATIPAVFSITIGAIVISIAVAHSVLIVPVPLARIAQCQAAETENHQQAKNNGTLEFHDVSPFRDLVWFSSEGVSKERAEE